MSSGEENLGVYGHCSWQSVLLNIHIINIHMSIHLATRVLLTGTILTEEDKR